MAIHPTAIVDPKAQIDPSVDIGPYCVIEGFVHLAAGCRLYHNVFVTGWTEIGENTELHPGVIVGHAPQDMKYKGEKSFCRIGRDNILREYVTVHRGTIPESETVIGDHCFLLGGSHVGHNCRVGSHVTLINNALLAGHVEVCDRVTIGGGAAIHQFVRIGELSMLPGNGRVPMDVVPFALLDVEGRILGLNRVGLRRSGFSRNEVNDIREAYRCLFDTTLSFVERVKQMTQEVSTPSGRRILEFVKGESRRGLAGRARRRWKEIEPSGD